MVTEGDTDNLLTMMTKLAMVTGQGGLWREFIALGADPSGLGASVVVGEEVG